MQIKCNSKKIMKTLIIWLMLDFVVFLALRIVANHMKEHEGIMRKCSYIPFLLFLLISLFKSFYSVGEQESGVVTTFGVPEVVEESGIHFKIPFIQKVEKVDTTIKGMPIGYDLETDESIQEDCLMITNDYNFVNVDFYVEYMVSSPLDYLYSVEKPEVVLKNLMQSCIRSVISNYVVDEVLTTGKGQIQADVKEMASTMLENVNIGITIINVAIQDAEPPTAEVISAFKNVETAKQNKETKINEAKKYSSEKLPANEADVDKILQDAETQKEQRINEAKQEVALFNARYEEFVKDEETVKQRMFLETMEKIVPDLKIVVNGIEMDINGLYPLDSLN